jgi:apolipoprotein D and lipocalin family protein
MGALKAIGSLLLILSVWGCQTMNPIHTVESVDLKRFMGDWYVIASIPTLSPQRPSPSQDTFVWLKSAHAAASYGGAIECRGKRGI